MPGTSRDKQGQWRDNQGQGRDKQRKAGAFTLCPCLFLLVPVCLCLSMPVPVCPCLFLSVPVWPCLPCLYLYVSTFDIPPCLPLEMNITFFISMSTVSLTFFAKATVPMDEANLFLTSSLIFYVAFSITLSFNTNSSILVIKITKVYFKLFFFFSVNLCNMWLSFSIILILISILKDDDLSYSLREGFN